VAQSIIDILTREHRHIEGLFSQLRETKGDQREQMFESLKDILIEHSRSEERVLYPQLEALSDLRKLADDAREDHATADQLLNELDSKKIEAKDWLACLATLEETVDHHVKFEEDLIFPRLRQYFLIEELRIMGEEYLRVEGRVKQVQTVKSVIRTLTKTMQNKLGEYFGPE
jgi:hemerythrin superfamily protein